jgi:hypothetical protein
MTVKVTLSNTYSPMKDDIVQQLVVYVDEKAFKYMRFAAGDYTVEQLAAGFEELARQLREKK